MSIRTVTLIRNGHRHVFRYRRGDESRVIEEICRQAQSGQTGLDYVDAAMLSFQVTQQAAAGGWQAVHAVPAGSDSELTAEGQGGP